MKLLFATSLFLTRSLASSDEWHRHLRVRHLNGDDGFIIYGHENGCIVPTCLGSECGAFFASCNYPTDSNTNTHWYQDDSGLLHSGSDHSKCLQAAWGNVVNDGSKVRYASCDANKATQQFEPVTASGNIKLKMRSDLCLIAHGNPPIKDVSQIILKACGVVGNRAIWRALDLPTTPSPSTQSPTTPSPTTPSPTTPSPTTPSPTTPSPTTLSPTTLLPTTLAPTTPPQTGLNVAVYYYPWYGNNFHGGKYLRHDLEMQQRPVLDEYDDSDPSVIAKHLEWSKDANIRTWVTSWWGPDSYEDKTIRNVILPHRDIGDLQIAVHYESTGRGRNSTGQLDEALILERADSDIAHLCQHYFSHPNYMRIGGKPVVVFYLSRYYESAPELQPGLMRETSRVMKEAARNCGESGVYLIGDHAFNDILLPLDYLDAITNYDVYGSIQAYSNGEYYAKQSGIDQYVAMQEKWRTHAQQQGKGFIPAASPGFNDRSVRLEADHVPLSRKLTPDAAFGSLFEESLNKAVDMVDASTGNMLLINSWNEWHEDTQIEPVIGFSSSKSSHLTMDVEYEGYAFRYLDMLRKLPSESLPPPPPPEIPPPPPETTPPSDCPSTMANPDDLYLQVNDVVLNGYCRDLYGGSVSAVRAGGYDWKCQNADQSISDEISIADVCAREVSPNHVEVLLGGTEDDWACVNWEEARYSVVPVIVVASDFVSDRNAISGAVESVTATVERVREWYEEKMTSGKTFRLGRPILRLSSRTGEYWNELSCKTAIPQDRPQECLSNDPEAKRYEYLYQASGEAQETSLGVSPQDITVPIFVFTGPDASPFWLGAAAAGQFSVNPPNVAVCPVNSDTCGLYSIAHEIGHSFNLAHSCENLAVPEPQCYNGIMENPPDVLNAVLFEFEQGILDGSCFFRA